MLGLEQFDGGYTPASSELVRGNSSGSPLLEERNLPVVVALSICAMCNVLILRTDISKGNRPELVSSYKVQRGMAGKGLAPSQPAKEPMSNRHFGVNTFYNGRPVDALDHDCVAPTTFTLHRKGGECILLGL